MVSCEGKAYPSRNSLRRHYTTHDPEMFANLQVRALLALSPRTVDNAVQCPVCGAVGPDDHPGDMRKHVVEQHDKTEDWAKAHIVMVSYEYLFGAIFGFVFAGHF